MIKKIEKKESNPMVSFMKKQAAKSKDHSSNIKSVKIDKNSKQNVDEMDEDENLTDEEKLEKAKKESRAKAAQINKAHMLKKLFLESIAKYFLMIAILVGVAFLVIEGVPLIIKFFHGLIHNILFSAIEK